MTRNITSYHGSADRSAIEAGIRRAHELRAQAFTGLVAKAAKAIPGLARIKAPGRQLGQLSEHVLKDIGLRPDQLSGLVSEALRRDELALSPAGNASAPAFRLGAVSRSKSTNDNGKTARAA